MLPRHLQAEVKSFHFRRLLVEHRKFIYRATASGGRMLAVQAAVEIEMRQLKYAICVSLLMTYACESRTVNEAAVEDLSSVKNSDNSIGANYQDRNIEEKACIMTVSGQPEPLSIFEFTANNGGRSCFDGQEILLFIPDRGSGCPNPDLFQLTSISHVQNRDAERSFSLCHKSQAEPSQLNNGSLTFRLEGKITQESGNLFLEFYNSIMALVTNDGLKVNYIGSYNNIACIEGPNLRDVKQHIIASDIIHYNQMRVELHSNSCLVVGELLTASKWPRSTPDR